MPVSTQFFTEDEVERARAYHRPRYLLLLADALLRSGVLALLAFAWPGDRIDAALGGVPGVARAAVEAVVALAAVEVLELPGHAWIGHVRERRYGFSTQTFGAWLADRAKAFAIGAAVTAAGLAALVALARALPRWWVVPAAAGAALFALAVGFLAPVVLEPLFNRFRPLEEKALADDLRTLAERAEVPVRDVLVSDASRRTTKHNAYVSGLGRTRRVVVFDTLLARKRPRELCLIVAHELGHRRAKHVLKGTLLAVAGAAGFVVSLWAVLHWSALPSPSNPRVAPVVLLLGLLLELSALPLGAALSRRWEREADRFSLELTGDRDAYLEAHRTLATANLSDLDPPRPVYLLTFSHPTPPERLAAAAQYGRTAPT